MRDIKLGWHLMSWEELEFKSQPCPASGRAPGGRNDNPLQNSCLENPMDRGAWQATVHGIAKRWTWLSTRALFSVRVWLHCSKSHKCLPHPVPHQVLWASLLDPARDLDLTEQSTLSRSTLLLLSQYLYSAPNRLSERFLYEWLITIWKYAQPHE